MKLELQFECMQRLRRAGALDKCSLSKVAGRMVHCAFESSCNVRNIVPCQLTA